MEQQFIEWYSDLYLVDPDFQKGMVNMLKGAYAAGYAQHKSEEQENGRLLKGILEGMRIDP